MNVKCRFQDGVTGGVLTADHSQSSYGMPIFVPDNYTSDYMPADCYGPGDLLGNTPLVIEEEISADDLAAIRNAGFRVVPRSTTADCLGSHGPEDCIV